MDTIEHSVSAAATEVYETECHNEFNTPRDLHLDIEVGDKNATIHCATVEHVGSHRKRKVTFLADKDCTLIFKNREVFGRTSLPLTGGRESTLQIDDEVGKAQPVWTYCSVKPLDPSKDIPREFQCPPKIEVP